MDSECRKNVEDESAHAAADAVTEAAVAAGAEAVPTDAVG